MNQYIYIILSACCYGFSEFLKAIGIKFVNKNIFVIGYYLLTALFSFILNYLMDNKILDNIKNTKPNDYLYMLLAALFGTGAAYLYFQSMSYNNNSKNPVNIGILSGILAINFIVTLFVDIIYKLYKKEKLTITIWEILGCVLIISGILMISLIKKSNK